MNDLPDEMEIGELAERSGQSVRNLRAYLQLGLLEPAGKRGRNLIFDESHLRRLRQIERFRERGYRLAAIADVLSEGGEALLADDVEAFAAMTTRWVRNESHTWTMEELTRLLPSVEDVEQFRDLAITRGLAAERDGDVVATRPELFRAAADLTSKGVPFERLMDMPADLRVVLAPVVGYVTERYTEMLETQGVDARETFEDLWPSVLLVLASELTRELFDAGSLVGAAGIDDRTREPGAAREAAPGS